MKLSDDQRAALEQLYYFTKSHDSYITLGGYAGVGKSTLMGVYRKVLYRHNPKLKVAFCSFTGRATRVLKQKIAQFDAAYTTDSVSTIHSLIYSPIIANGNKISGWKLKDSLKYHLIIVDEASMIGRKLWEDLMSFQIPIIAVGDHGQLPPIDSSFNLMNSPTIRLEKIHRQAEQNPIIKVSLLARENGFIPPRVFEKNVLKIDQSSEESMDRVESLLRQYTADTLVLCGYNKTRIQLNQFIRSSIGFEEITPTKGDRIICLKNNHQKHIYNGMLGTISKINIVDADWYDGEIYMDDEEEVFEGKVLRKQFGSLDQTLIHSVKFNESGDFFDFGYALTVHKAQGSQAKRVIVFEERFNKMDDLAWRRWLYTAVTRAEEELYVIGKGNN